MVCKFSLNFPNLSKKESIIRGRVAKSIRSKHNNTTFPGTLFLGEFSSKKQYRRTIFHANLVKELPIVDGALNHSYSEFNSKSLVASCCGGSGGRTASYNSVKIFGEGVGGSTQNIQYLILFNSLAQSRNSIETIQRQFS